MNVRNRSEFSIVKLFFLTLLFTNPLIAQNVLRYELGIHRPNLNWLGTLEEEKQLIDKMDEMGAQSIRLNPTATSAVADFIEHVKYANSLGIKVNMVIQLTAFPEFYPNGTTKRPQVGIWGPRYRLSDIEPENIRLWAASVFDQIYAAGAQIELVELGNEVNWIDYNGDLPYVQGGAFYDYNTDWNDTTYVKIREGFSKYGETLTKIRSELDRVWGTGNIKLITHGAVQGHQLSSWSQTNGASVLSTAVMLDLLQGTHPELSVGSSNYLNSVDGIGIHFYPSTVELNMDLAKESVADEIRDIMNPLIDVVGDTIPFWVTEWGYPKNKFVNNSQTDRYQMFKNFLAVCHGLPYKWGKFYLFTFDNSTSHQVYENGSFLSGSQIFTDYQFSPNGWDLDTGAYKIQNSYSDMYLRGYDENGTNKDGDDSYITIINDQPWSTLKWYLQEVPDEIGVYRIKNEHTGLYIQGFDPNHVSGSTKPTQHSLEGGDKLKWRIMPSLYEGEFDIQGIYEKRYIWTSSTTEHTNPTLLTYKSTWTSMRWLLVKQNPSLKVISHELNDENLRVFPNPVNEDVNFYLSENLKTTVSIYNSTGILVYRNDYRAVGHHKIPMSHLNSGIYIVKISNNNHSVNKKIIKM